jgi:dihydrofolate reductase/thymidylate synthase
MKRFQVILAATQNGGIGNANALPWPKLKQDLNFFRVTTTQISDPKSDMQNAVIMGRCTYESLPMSHKPLPNRFNIVLSKNQEYKIDEPGRSKVCASLDDAMAWLNSYEAIEFKIESVFIIGGAGLYNEAIQSELCDKVHLTRVFNQFQCDRFIDANALQNYSLETKGGVCYDSDKHVVQFEFQTWLRHCKSENEEEKQYLDLLRRVRDTGVMRNDRTNVGTVGVFGATMRFDLSKNKIPIITTRQLSFRIAIIELLFMIKGQTDTKLLEAQNVNIWRGNTSRAFLDDHGFHDRAEGDMGAMYGFQWRHWNAEYKGCSKMYSSQDGIDQLGEAIKLIKNDPNSRRIVISAWNPSAINQGVLPPCHCLMQFYVANNKLSCQMYQRSADLYLGVAFNIVFYSILTRMLCEVTGLEPGEFVWTGGDVHIYKNHLNQVEEQLKRSPFPFPTLKIKSGINSIDDFTFPDFEVEDYKSYPRINAPMAI